jgi:hypothetical protein
MVAPTWDWYMRALMVSAVAAALAVGCGAAPQPAPHRATPASAQVRLTRLQACRRLLADLTINRGVPDIRTLRAIADHVTAPRLAADARTAVQDIDHTGAAPVAISLLRAECAPAGVRIPAP